MNVGEKIRAARLAKGLTQEELGNILGVQKSAIAKYENGRVVNIKRSTLQKLAKALDLKGSDLIQPIEENPIEAADFVALILSDRKTMDMIKEYYQLDEKNQTMVRQMVHNLKKPEV